MEKRMLGVIARMQVREDKTSEFEAAMKDHMAVVKANEPGCIIYQLYKPKKSTTEYVMMEQYSSSDAFKAHTKTEHAAAIAAKLQPCLSAAPEVQLLDMIE